MTLEIAGIATRNLSPDGTGRIRVPRVDILGIPIAAINLNEAVEIVDSLVRNGERAFVTVTGVHGIMESQYDVEVKRAHRMAAMCVPDGMPTVWIGKLYGHRSMDRVYGPDLMLAIMERSLEKGYRHFLFGGKPGVPELLRDRLKARFPGLAIVGTMSPPFRPMTEHEEKSFSSLLDAVSPDILWVGLSTPKQERWMAQHCAKMNTKVMIGVGAAFDFHAGLVRQAPRWVQRIGMEWFFRLCIEPRRLWRRYVRNNPRFIIKVAAQILGLRQYE